MIVVGVNGKYEMKYLNKPNTIRFPAKIEATQLLKIISLIGKESLPIENRVTLTMAKWGIHGSAIIICSYDKTLKAHYLPGQLKQPHAIPGLPFIFMPKRTLFLC